LKTIEANCEITNYKDRNETSMKLLRARVDFCIKKAYDPACQTSRKGPKHVSKLKPKKHLRGYNNLTCRAWDREKQGLLIFQFRFRQHAVRAGDGTQMATVFVFFCQVTSLDRTISDTGSGDLPRVVNANYMLVWTLYFGFVL
jgi:hypothetical protein